MTKRLLIALSLVSCASLGGAVDANAAKKKKAKVTPAPAVKSIVPMRAQVGEKLTINGTNFIAGKGKTKVYFLREGGGVAWVPADTSTKTRLIVTVPEKLIPLLRGTAENREPTKFQIRILAKRFGLATRLAKSPVFTAPNAAPADPGAPAPGTPGPGTPPDGDCDGDGAKNSVDADDDNDALSDADEVMPAHTDPCKADTDGDSVADGFEFHSAKDINVTALPYPAKKPWPNPLDSEDATIDHDGDGLTMIDEHLLWKYYGNLSLPLNYSAGLQKSAIEYAPTEIEKAYMDMDGDCRQPGPGYKVAPGCTLSDDERDGDGDGLTNWDESHGRMLQDWWDAKYDGQNYPSKKETRYPNTFPGVSIFDPDSDGDEVEDGDDDQDHDGLPNKFEVVRPMNWLATYTWYGYPDTYEYTVASDNPWSRVQPYNPCKPVWSITCHLHPPFGHYEAGEPWAGQLRSQVGPQPTAPWTWPGSSDDALPSPPNG